MRLWRLFLGERKSESERERKSAMRASAWFSMRDNAKAARFIRRCKQLQVYCKRKRSRKRIVALPNTRKLPPYILHQHLIDLRGGRADQPCKLSSRASETSSYNHLGKEGHHRTDQFCVPKSLVPSSAISSGTRKKRTRGVRFSRRSFISTWFVCFRTGEVSSLCLLQWHLGFKVSHLKVAITGI